MTTLIGYGSPNKAGTHDVHGAALGESETEETRNNLGWKYPPFELPGGVKETMSRVDEVRFQGSRAKRFQGFCESISHTPLKLALTALQLRAITWQHCACCKSQSALPAGSFDWCCTPGATSCDADVLLSTAGR